jgi:hypothetical protein
MGLINYYSIKSNAFHRISTNVQLIRQDDVVLAGQFLVRTYCHFQTLKSLFGQSFAQNLVIIAYNEDEQLLGNELSKQFLNKFQMGP